jgi:hypothetical protein
LSTEKLLRQQFFVISLCKNSTPTSLKPRINNRNAKMKTRSQLKCVNMINKGNVTVEVNGEVLEITSKINRLEKLVFWKQWSHRLEVPLASINEFKRKRRCGIDTLYVFKTDRIIPFQCIGLTENQYSQLHSLFQFQSFSS